MQKQFYILFSYFICLGASIRTLNPILIGSMIILGLLILSLAPLYKKLRKENIKKQLKDYPNCAILNINRASWWEFEVLPGISRVEAKRIVQIRRKQKRYSSKDDFFQKNKLKDKENIEKLIFIK